ncbi:MAG: Class II abasic (AP) endonuclease [Watsoniomyces obsoletus]|nr:MAG: Class II abasic (AP) endonuclease [Watsoniomyces obsoletus]
MAPQVPWAVTPTNLDDHITYCEGLIQEVREDKRKFSPRFLLQVRGFKKELKGAQQDDSHDDTDRFKRLTKMRGFLAHHVDAVANHRLLNPLMLEDLRKMRLAKFLLDYSDYLTFNLDQLRTEHKFHAMAWNKNFWSWAEILKVVEDPKLTGNLAASAEMEMQLQAAAIELGCTYKHLLWEIKTYAERNRVAHSEVQYFAALRKWPQLAIKITMDAKTLPDLIPPEKQDELHEFQTAVELARKRFFQFIAEDAPGSFQLSPYSLRLDGILADRRRQKIANQKKQEMLIESKRPRSEQRSREASEAQERHKRAREASELSSGLRELEEGSVSMYEIDEGAFDALLELAEATRLADQ